MPLNPGVSGSPTTRPNTSKRIEEAAALISQRARESAPSSYVPNSTPTSSPEKGLNKSPHKRLQSIQNNNVRGISDSLERRSPDKGLRTPRFSDNDDLRLTRSPERSPVRSGSETPTPSGRVTPSYLNKPILGENTPPSATMLALQSIRNRQEAEAPLSNITNMTALTRSQSPMTYDAISAQILSLTSIATNLQREMLQLSRRSKDNATDLMSLKEATNSRDEDIRKSLKDLLSGLDTNFKTLDTKLLCTPPASRSTPNLGLYLDDKPHNSPSGRKNFNLPRIGSPTNFAKAIDRELTGSPSLTSSEGAGSIALLEKVLREMGTKDGQGNILAVLEQVKRETQGRNSSPVKSGSMSADPKMMQKLDEIMLYLRDLKENPATHALVKATGRGVPGQIDLFFDDQPKSGQLSKFRRDSDSNIGRSNSRGSELVNDELMKMLKSVKQSLAQGGGLTNEVKTLVRDLRAEVLGMGREIARKLDQPEKGGKNTSRHVGTGADPEAINQIVQSGLAELKEHMHHIVRENRRQSAGSTKSLVDTQEVVLAVRSALAEMPRSTNDRNMAAEKAELLAGIKEAWEDCKPEVQLEHFGLERDEILETLKEGLQLYHQDRSSPRDVGITYEEVLDAVRKGLADFRPPSIQTEAGATREEILLAVREVMENFDVSRLGPTASQLSGSDINRDDILDAIHQGLSKQPPVTKEIEFNRKDLFDAVRSSLEGESNPLGSMGERVLDSMHEFLTAMKTEFQQYSAANGKDTEQVLDAMKDGLEELRADIESYVDRAADVTGKDEIIDVVKAGFQTMHADIERSQAGAKRSMGNPDTPELLDAMEKEFHHLRETLQKSLVPGNNAPSFDKDEILDAIRDISDDRQSSLSSNSEDIARLVKEELEHMRIALAGTLTRGSAAVQREDVLDAVREGLESHREVRRDGGESMLSNTSELMDAFQEGVDNIRTDMQKLVDRPVDLSANYEILDTLKAGIENVRSDIERLHAKQIDLSEETASLRNREVVVHDENMISTEIEGLKVMITQLRIKVEAIDTMSQTAPGGHLHKEDLSDIHAAIREVRDTVNTSRSAQEASSKTATKDDTDAIETLLRNVKASLEDLSLSDGEGIARTGHLNSIEDLLRDIKVNVEETALHDPVPREDFTIVELLLKEVSAGIDEIQHKVKTMAANADNVTKADIQAIESLCLDTKTQIQELALPDPEVLATKDDVHGMEDSIKAFHEQIEASNELTAQAFEARKIEHGGIASKIEDVRGVIGDLRDELMSKLDGSEEGIVELAKVLGDHHDSMTTYATASSMAELSELVNREFERHMDHNSSSRQLNEYGHATLLAKHEEISGDLRASLDNGFSELLAKYDDGQLASDAKLRTLQDMGRSQSDNVTTTRAVVDDMKMLLETLGTSVTEACDRLSDDTRTVFGRVEEVHTRVGELNSTNVQEHGLTRGEIAKALATALRLEGSIQEHQPATMATLQQILGLVGQHFEHSQKQSENISRATDEIKSGISAVPASIPPLLPALLAPVEPLVREIPVHQPYDDTQVHDKLNNLISHAAVAKEAFVKIDTHHKNTEESLAGLHKIEQIHDQVMTTAVEISAMVATQSRLMNEHHDSRAAEATEAAIALEKRNAQKEKVEHDIAALMQEKEALVGSMAELKREHADLNTQTRRLTREVAKLETALNIRHEEMKDMNGRAETLEKRIIEGVMNHARSSKISRLPKKAKITPEERDRAMSLKRVPSSTSNATARTSVKDTSSSIGNVVSMALKKRTAFVASPNSTVSSRQSGVGRRILSTSNVQGNKRETLNRAVTLAPVHNTGLVSLKRSHSVKNNEFVDRKTSWSPAETLGVNKENQILDENEDERSDAGTERRTSFGGTSAMYTDAETTTSMLYGTGSSLSTNGTRTASYASSVGGTIDGVTGGGQGENGSIAEEDEEAVVLAEGDAAHEAQQQDDESAAIMALLEPPPATNEQSPPGNNALVLASAEGFEHPDDATVSVSGAALHSEWLDGLSDLRPPPRLLTDHVKYHHHQNSDSGLGTEPPTASIEVGEAQEYFDMCRRDGRQGEQGVDV